MAIKIVFFNHKGGVSKTTTTYNLGWMLGILGKKVLVVDADPQCNLSSLILGDYFDDYYTDDSTKFQNIKDGVKVAFEGKPKPIEAVTCFSPSQNENLFLLAGHANLSEYDASLSFAQNSNNAITALMNLPGAFNELINQTSEKYDVDYVLIDLNPGLSAINQNFFILSDAFIIPTNPDPFSIMAIQTLSNILPRWIDWADKMRPLFSDSSYPLSYSRPKFIGEIIQGFNIRNGKAASPYKTNINDIKQMVKGTLLPTLIKSDMVFEHSIYEEAEINDDYCIAEIPNFQSILQKANNAGVPVFVITDAQIQETGPILTQLKGKRTEFYQLFEKIAKQIITIGNHANSQEPVLA
ncbi:MAG: ParA family protein [Arcicella sp.]|nr:ParA family protein [Arcicella sp.]